LAINDNKISGTADMFFLNDSAAAASERFDGRARALFTRRS
jgi:hypothetical protein